MFSFAITTSVPVGAHPQLLFLSMYLSLTHIPISYLPFPLAIPQSVKQFVNLFVKQLRLVTQLFDVVSALVLYSIQVRVYCQYLANKNICDVHYNMRYNIWKAIMIFLYFFLKKFLSTYLYYMYNILCDHILLFAYDL